MGMGGDKFRTWSDPGGSSHKEPLTSAHAYSGHFLLSLYIDIERTSWR